MALSHMFLRGAAVGLVILLAGCATYTPPASAPAPVKQPQPEPKPKVTTPPSKVPQAPPRPATPSASAALRPLLAKAGQATERGDYEQALTLLERAQRIDPDSAEVYLGMAQTHRARGNIAQARATAERGLLYCATEAQCSALRAFTR
jgi:Tfp pilus assembly protein PilF